MYLRGKNIDFKALAGLNFREERRTKSRCTYENKYLVERVISMRKNKGVSRTRYMVYDLDSFKVI